MYSWIKYILNFKTWKIYLIVFYINTSPEQQLYLLFCDTDIHYNINFSTILVHPNPSHTLNNVHTTTITLRLRNYMFPTYTIFIDFHIYILWLEGFNRKAKSNIYLLWSCWDTKEKFYGKLNYTLADIPCSFLKYLWNLRDSVGNKNQDITYTTKKPANCAITTRQPNLNTQQLNIHYIATTADMHVYFPSLCKSGTKKREIPPSVMFTLQDQCNEEDKWRKHSEIKTLLTEISAE